MYSRIFHVSGRNAPTRKANQMARWSENLEELPRNKALAQQGFTFSSPANARKGDLWSNPSAGIKDKFIVKDVIKWTDADYGSIWYDITFDTSDTSKSISGIKIGENAGMGTFQVPIKQDA
jgi:hypothetical protein